MNRNVEHFDILLNDIEIPAKDTTYWCKIQKLKDTTKRRHIVEFEPVIKSEEFVHHMEVFHCEAKADVEIPLFEGNCDDLPVEAKVCSKVMALWVSVGSKVSPNCTLIS
jgi:dopamine beta-monooxygenase